MKKQETTRWPSLCPNCHHILGPIPRAWLRILDCFQGTRNLQSRPLLVKRLKISRQRMSVLMSELSSAGYIIRPLGNVGVYSMTRSGEQFRNHWRRALRGKARSQLVKHG